MITKKDLQYVIKPTGGGGADISDTTATASDVLSPKDFYLADGTKTRGTIPTYDGSTAVTPTEQAQTLPTDDKYVTENITVAPIPAQYKDTTGTDAVAGDMLSGKKAVTGAGLVTGSIPTYDGATAITQNGTIAVGGKYCPSNLTVNISSFQPIEKDVNFYDYDGTLVYSYTAAEFANLSAMPANPSHTRLVAQGWNWTLADAKTYVATYGKLNIGQIYATASGKTEYDIEVNEEIGMTAYLRGESGTEMDWGDGTIDTDNTHTYLSPGRYTIKESGTNVSKFDNKKLVRAVYVANGVTVFTLQTFSGCSFMEYLTIPNSVTEIHQQCFMESVQLRALNIPNSIMVVGSDGITGLFINCVGLSIITLPNSSLFTIADFSQNYMLRSLSIGSGLTTTGTAFSKAYSLRFFIIPNGVTEIPQSSFNNCSSLIYLKIPSSVTSIGSSAFRYCLGLTTITVLANTPPTLANKNAFSSYVEKIYIPNGTLSAYQSATNWSNFSSKFVELPA